MADLFGGNLSDIDDASPPPNTAPDAEVCTVTTCCECTDCVQLAPEEHIDVTVPLMMSHLGDQAFLVTLPNILSIEHRCDPSFTFPLSNRPLAQAI